MANQKTSPKPPSVSFVPFTEDHLPAAMEMYNYYIASSTVLFRSIPVSAEEFSGKVFCEDTRFRTFAVVDDLDGAFAGYFSVGQYRPGAHYEHTAKISIYLRPQYTGKGLGGLALAHAETHARSAGFHSIIAGISSENGASIKLFERNGYEHVARLREVGSKFGRFIDLVYMQKIL
jgi:L-amino acid N-acyltransferase YncA